jgi:deferrochelatase/peroxidase EfeB
MSRDNDPVLPGRRQFLSAGLATAGLAAAGAAAPALAKPRPADTSAVEQSEPFFGKHQSGVTTRQQKHLYFAAYDLVADQRNEVIALLRAWTEAAARMSRGQTAAELSEDAAAAPLDSGDTLGLPPHRLTFTFGFGPGLFVKDGKDRYGLAQCRPEALIDLPRFNGDQLVPERTGGDLCVQICADDPQVALHAARQLQRLADPAAKMRWAQTGFQTGSGSKETPRNLMGFKDGTMNPSTDDPAVMDQVVWVGEEGGWMKHGTYMVARPIRIALEHWDRMKLGFQEQVVGRHKRSGAPLGGTKEFDKLDLDAVDKDGNSVIPDNAHARLAAPESNDGAQILRRGYSYDNGLNFTTERWPPWRQGYELDAGLMFVCYQRDPRSGFVKVFDRVAKFDMMNQFVTHVGGGVFACPAGVSEGRYVGQALFEA